jgi:DNA-binding HxlR family transcriptional regulator
MLLKDCPVRDTIDVIHGKWKSLVLVALKPGSRRFGQLCREVPEAKQKVLTQQLRELEADGIVSRTVSGTRSLRVEYALTPYGKTLVRVLTAMAEWGALHRKRRAPISRRNS